MSSSDDELEYLLQLRERMAAALQSSNERIAALRGRIEWMEERKRMEDEQEDEEEESSKER